MELTEQELDLIIRSTPGDIVIYKLSGDVATRIYYSANMPSYTGHTDEEYKQISVGNAMKNVFPGDRELVLSKAQAALAGDGNMDYTYRIIHKTKGVVWAHVRAHHLGTMDGIPLLLTEFYNISDDVDGYAEMINHSNNIIYVIDEKTYELLYANTKALEFFGSNDYAGKKCYEYARGNTSSCPWCIIKKMTGTAVSERGFCDPELGIVIDVDCQRIHWFDRKAIFIYVHDVTEQTKQHQHEQELYKRTMHELLLSNSQTLCAFRLNLTQDTCEEGHGMSKYIQKLVSAKTATATIENIITLIPDKTEAKKFYEAVNCQQLLEDFSKGEYHKEISYQRRNEQGEIIWVTTYANIIKNPDTNDIETICYSVDVSHEKEEEQVISAITRRDYDYIAIIDVDTQRVRVLNIGSYTSPVRPVTRYTYEDSLRDTFSKYQSIGEEQKYMESLSFSNILWELETKENFIFSYLLEDDLGNQYRKQMTYRYLDQNKAKILFVRTDVTASFIAEQEQAKKIQSALMAAEYASEMKSSFLSNVSHDMRTPLNAILGYAALAKDTPDQSVQQDYLEKIGVAGKTLLNLINDTLDLQKIENGIITLNPSDTSCSEIFNSILASVQPLAKEKGINFSFDNHKVTKCNISADDMRVQEIFINLLSNAVKYTPAGGNVEFIVETIGEDEHYMHDKVTVRDNGIGMSKGFLPIIFEPFTQERTKETSHIDGSGLGLSIVKRLIDLMGWRIEVQSELGKGTEFVVYLDFLKLCSNEGKVDALDEADVQKKLIGLHILMCEDNLMNTEIAKIMLESAGIDVTCAADGKSGVDLFENSHVGDYDAILMDIRMPVMNGYDATREIRNSQHPQAKEIPIIALSADAYESDVKKSLAAGMNDHIGKPINPQLLFKTIAIACNKL